MDGFYEAENYPQLMQLECDENFVTDGTSLYFAVLPDGVLNVTSAMTKVFVKQIEKLYESEKGLYDYEDISAWAEDSEEQLEEAFDSVATTITPTYVETLKKPRLMELELA